MMPGESNDMVLEAKSGGGEGGGRWRILEIPPLSERSLRDYLARGRNDYFMVPLMVSPKMAARLFEMKMDNNLRHKPRKVENYRRLMDGGQWILCSQGIAISDTGKLVNGHHRLEALIKAKVDAVPMSVVFGADESEYDVTDQGMTRQLSQLLSYENSIAYAALVRAINSVSGLNKVDRDNVSLLRFAHEHVDPALAMDALNAAQKSGADDVSSPKTRALAYYWIIKHSSAPRQEVSQFWDRFAGGLHLEPGVPWKMKREELESVKRAKTDQRMRQIPISDTLTTAKVAGEIILTWNLFVQGRKRLKRGERIVWESGNSLPTPL